MDVAQALYTRCLKCNHNKCNRCKNLIFTAARPNECRLQTTEEKLAESEKRNEAFEDYKNNLEGYGCQSDDKCVDKSKGNLCKNGTCLQEVLWLGWTLKPANVILSKPGAFQENKKHIGCWLEPLPSDLQSPLVSVTNKTIRACGRSNQGESCFRLQENKWINFNPMNVTRNEAAGITFANGSWWVTGGKATNGTASSSTEIFHPWHKSRLFFLLNVIYYFHRLDRRHTYSRGAPWPLHGPP